MGVRWDCGASKSARDGRERAVAIRGGNTLIGVATKMRKVDRRALSRKRPGFVRRAPNVLSQQLKPTAGIARGLNRGSESSAFGSGSGTFGPLLHHLRSIVVGTEFADARQSLEPCAATGATWNCWRPLSGDSHGLGVLICCCCDIGGMARATGKKAARATSSVDADGRAHCCWAQGHPR